MAFLWSDAVDQLYLDLQAAKKITEEEKKYLPFVYNSSYMIGSLNMPSARVNASGMVAAGYGHIAPYNIVGLNLMPFQRIEVSANYRLFPGQAENNLSQYGFGDDADRGANFKVQLLSETDGLQGWPSISFGMEDFYGSRRFAAEYLVATKTWKDWNLEASFGWGWERIKGPFGSIHWTPFRDGKVPLLDGITLIGEYDATDYAGHYWEHGDGRSVTSKVNAGVAVTLFDALQVKAATQRGESYAVQGSLNYNLGETKGLFPKIMDARPWERPIDYEPIGTLRTEKELAQQFAYAFQEQGLSLASLYLVGGSRGKGLRLKLLNVRYRYEPDLKERVNKLLAALTPCDMDHVDVIVESDGVPVQQYSYRYADLARFRSGKIGKMELDTLSPMKTVQPFPDKHDVASLFQRNKPVWTVMFRPRLLSFFGSSRGKYKYSFGFIGGLSGYLFDSIYYDSLVSFTAAATIYDMNDYDFYNPSQLVNVRTDAIRYFQEGAIHLERLYAQKGWNLPNSVYFRLAGGYFEPMFGGVASEMLFYPANSAWAIGLEAAGVLKREYNGLGFQHKIRKLKGFTPTYEDYIGQQYFVNAYYYFKPINVELMVKGGMFLARDLGARFEATRYFPSGMSLSFWYTLTNANDWVNGKKYHDRGAAITFPLDIFLQKSSRAMLGYAMSFWLRDCGAYSFTGNGLYNTINRERRGYAYSSY